MMSHTVGFYRLLETRDNKGFIGALLVTDAMGKPEEFRVTYPVKPTIIQRQLYGEALRPHIGVELCGKPLVGALKKKLTVLLVHDSSFLSIADAIEVPVAYLQLRGDQLRVSTIVSEIQSDRPHSGRLDSVSGRFPTISVSFPLLYTDVDKQKAMEVLTHLYGIFDLLEPFQRIEVAVTALAAQDNRFT